MIFPILVIGTGLAALLSARKKPGPFEVDDVTAAKRRAIYEAALNSKDVNVLREAESAFRAEGCTVEADLLAKRIIIAELPHDVAKARQETFRKLMRSTDPVLIRRCAAIFDEEGCTGAAVDLNRYASGLEDAAKLESEERAARESLAEGVANGTEE